MIIGGQELTMSDFYIQEIKRPRGLRWLIASCSSADFAVLDDKKNDVKMEVRP